MSTIKPTFGVFGENIILNKRFHEIMKRRVRHPFTVILILSLHFFCKNTYSQQDDYKEKANDLNAIYFSAGTAVLWHGASLTYERGLNTNLFNKNISTFAKLGSGYYLIWDWSPEYGGPWAFSHYGWLLGKDIHHFEISAGVFYGFSGDLMGLFPSGTIGYRYNKPLGKFIFRANASFPEALNISAGFKF